MSIDTRYTNAYLNLAKEWAELSYCKRKKVGAIIVSNGQIISDGYNGTPSGFDNCCEDSNNLTKWEVIHAEANAILKVATSTNNTIGADLYLTLSPCKDCCKLIIGAKIKRVIYLEEYRDTTGLDILRSSGVEVIHYKK